MPTEEVFAKDGFGLNEDGSLVLGVANFQALLPGFANFLHEQEDRATKARDRLRQRHARHGGKKRR